MDDSTHPPTTPTVRAGVGLALTLLAGAAAVVVGLVGAGDLFATVWGAVLLTFADGILRTGVQGRPAVPPVDGENS